MHCAEGTQSAKPAKLPHHPKRFLLRNRRYIRLIYDALSIPQDRTPTQVRTVSSERTMLQYLVTSKGMEDMLLILSIAFMPSVLGLMCAFLALGLPDESKRSDRNLSDRPKLRPSR